MSNIGHWVTGIALIKACDTCGVVIGFRSRSMHRDLTPAVAVAAVVVVVSTISIFKTPIRTERTSSVRVLLVTAKENIIVPFCPRIKCVRSGGS